MKSNAVVATHQIIIGILINKIRNPLVNFSSSLFFIFNPLDSRPCPVIHKLRLIFGVHDRLVLIKTIVS